jgi:hypothetical protein
VYIQSTPGGTVFWEVIVSKKQCIICTCVLFRTVSETDISLYVSKSVDKKEILRTASNTGIYCSSGKVGAVYLVKYIPVVFSSVVLR